MLSPFDALTPAGRLARQDDLSLTIAEWDVLSREEPWHVDPHRYGIDRLHETIGAVLDVYTWGNAGPFTAERLVRSAAAHGEQRRAQGIADNSLMREYEALHAVIWQHVQRSSPPAPEGGAAALRLDVAIEVASIIALRAYHRSELPMGGGWQADILQQIRAVSRHLSDRFVADSGADS